MCVAVCRVINEKGGGSPSMLRRSASTESSSPNPISRNPTAVMMACERAASPSYSDLRRVVVAAEEEVEEEVVSCWLSVDAEVSVSVVVVVAVAWLGCCAGRSSWRRSRTLSPSRTLPVGVPAGGC